MEEHEIQPDTASIFREGTMIPARITEARDYPLEAICRCGQPVRCPSDLGDWSHTGISATARRMAFHAAHPQVHFDYESREHTAVWSDAAGLHAAARTSLHDLLDHLEAVVEPYTLPTPAAR